MTLIEQNHMAGMKAPLCQVFRRCAIDQRSKIMNKMCLVEITTGDRHIQSTLTDATDLLGYALARNLNQCYAAFPADFLYRCDSTSINKDGGINSQNPEIGMRNAPNAEVISRFQPINMGNRTLCSCAQQHN